MLSVAGQTTPWPFAETGVTVAVATASARDNQFKRFIALKAARSGGIADQTVTIAAGREILIAGVRYALARDLVFANDNAVRRIDRALAIPVTTAELYDFRASDLIGATRNVAENLSPPHESATLPANIDEIDALAGQPVQAVEFEARNVQRDNFGRLLSFDIAAIAPIAGTAVGLGAVELPADGAIYFEDNDSQAVNPSLDALARSAAQAGVAIGGSPLLGNKSFALQYLRSQFLDVAEVATPFQTDFPAGAEVQLVEEVAEGQTVWARFDRADTGQTLVEAADAVNVAVEQIAIWRIGADFLPGVFQPGALIRTPEGREYNLTAIDRTDNPAEYRLTGMRTDG